jgi:hypothetical protein
MSKHRATIPAPRCQTAMVYDIGWHAARATAEPAIVPGSARWRAVLAVWS